MSQQSSVEEQDEVWLCNMLRYKDHSGSIESNPLGLHGQLLKIKDLVTYEAATLPALKEAFKEACDDYEEMRASLPAKPEFPQNRIG